MSGLAKNFVEAARRLDWKTAYDELNGCNMWGMLDGLDEIGLKAMQDMRAQMSIYDVWGGPNMPRIRFAMDAIAARKAPTPPADLPQDQVEDARHYLQQHRGGTAPAATKRIRVALFWTQEAKKEPLSTLLVQRARELLHSSKSGFELDVSPMHVDLDYKGEITDDDDFARAMALAEAAPNYAPDRLCVIFFKITPTQCDPDKQQCPRIPFGATPRDGRGRPCVMININKSHPDNATLLHEIGHAAGIQSRDSDDALKDYDDIMSYGKNRTKISKFMIGKLSQRNLFFVG